MTTTLPADIAALLPLLEREAPRYTSYPSAHHFGPLGPGAQSAGLVALPRGERIGLYLHVPFCEELCWFCGCHTKATQRRQPVAGYVETLLSEIALLRGLVEPGTMLHSIHFGGGSPTILSPADLARLFAAIDRQFARDAATEISIEIDPRRLTPELAAAYGAHGFTRASIGVQDSDPRVMRAIGRPQPFGTVRAAAAMLRREGVTALNIDLMYGLPHQSPASIAQTLRDVAALDPGRIACFSYAHIPWVKPQMRLIDGAALPSASEKAALYLQIAEGLRAMGYRAIGMDHFAKPDDAMAGCFDGGTLRRNFQGYSTAPNDWLIGLGASAISQTPEGIAQNAPPLGQYRAAIEAGRLATARGWRFTDEDRARGAVIGALMCYFEADVAAILAEHGFPESHLDAEIASLAPLIEAGIAQADGRMVRFDAKLPMLVRTVAAAFDAYAAQAAEKRLSKVA